MKVAIIGAGIAGLTAARELAKRGINVQVFEKSRGVGGRLANKRLEWGNIDIGAQYFTARDARFQQQVDQWQQEGIVARWQFNPYSLTASGLTTLPDSTPRYVGTPKMNSLAHALARDIDVEFKTRIVALERTRDGWVLCTADGLTVQERYDWVVLSLPAEQSKALLTGTAIENQIPEYVHEPCWALALATLGDVPAEIQGVFGDEVVSWLSRLSSRPQRPIQKKDSHQKGSDTYDNLWMLHFSSDWSTIHTKESEVNVTQAGFEWLSRALEKHIDKPLQVVQDFKHYWLYARLKNGKAMSSVIADRSTGIAVIGAWSAGGRVEGAYLSALNFVDYFFE